MTHHPPHKRSTSAVLDCAIFFLCIWKYYKMPFRCPSYSFSTVIRYLELVMENTPLSSFCTLFRLDGQWESMRNEDRRMRTYHHNTHHPPRTRSRSTTLDCVELFLCLWKEYKIPSARVRLPTIHLTRVAAVPIHFRCFEWIVSTHHPPRTRSTSRARRRDCWRRGSASLLEI